ncbi:hypothetical protein ACQ86G_01835 [Roseateles chitinivorans]|uniref:hypothetical protein n=1 Tax=Roseateles chitinivorans TaxID=2917965 RepID=UPI003D677BC7
MPQFSVMTCAEAAERFGLSSSSMNYLRDLSNHHVLVHEGDWHLDGSLVLDWPGWGDAAWPAGFGIPENAQGFDIAGIAVIGDLRLGGSVLNINKEGGPFLVVTGHLTARAIASGGATITAHGDADIAEAVVSCYNHGELWLKGRVRTTLWLQDEHMMSAGRLEALVRFDARQDLDSEDYEEVFRTMPDGREQYFEVQNVPESLRELVVPEVLVYQDLWERVCADQPILTDEAIARRPA